MVTPFARWLVGRESSWNSDRAVAFGLPAGSVWCCGSLFEEALKEVMGRRMRRVRFGAVAGRAPGTSAKFFLTTERTYDKMGA